MLLFSFNIFEYSIIMDRFPITGKRLESTRSSHHDILSENGSTSFGDSHYSVEAGTGGFPQKSTSSDPLQFMVHVPHDITAPLSDEPLCTAEHGSTSSTAVGQTSEKPSEDDSKNSKSKWGRCGNFRSAFGIILGLLSGLSNSLMAAVIKLVESKSMFELAAYRYAVMIPPIAAYLLYLKINPFKIELIKASGCILVLRSVLGGGATLTSYVALQKLPLADASVIMFSSPVFVAIFARIFLKEPLKWSHGFAIVVTLGGCILVSRPPAIFGAMVDEKHTDWMGKIWGYLAAIGSAMLTAAVYVALRFMKDVHSCVVQLYTAVIGSIVALIVAGALQQFSLPTDAATIGSIFGVGALSLATNEFMNQALKLESAGLIALLRTFDMVWSFVFQLVIFKVTPHYLSIIGALLVVICVSMLSVKETVEKLPPESKVKIFIVRAMKPVNKAKEKVWPSVPCKGTRRKVALALPALELP